MDCDGYDMGMKEYEPLPRTGKLVRFVLDVDTSDAFLAKAFKEGFAEWGREQKQSKRANHNNHMSKKEKGIKANR
jgi:hypothetical protein